VSPDGLPRVRRGILQSRLALVQERVRKIRKIRHILTAAAHASNRPTRHAYSPPLTRPRGSQ
jgi:hypothetical protein